MEPVKELKRYVLDKDGNPHEEQDKEKWFAYINSDDPNKTVGRTSVEGKAVVSTIFMGMDIGVFDGTDKPRLYATQVLMEPALHDMMEQYTDRADAVAGHERIVQAVKDYYKTNQKN